MRGGKACTFVLPDSKPIPGLLRRDGTLTTGWPKVSSALRLKVGDIVQLRAEASGSSRFHVSRLHDGQRPMRPTAAQREAIAEAVTADAAAEAASAGQDAAATMRPTAAQREAIAEAEAAEAAAAGQDAAATSKQITAAPVHLISGAGFTVKLSKQYKGTALSILPSLQPAFAAIQASHKGARWITAVLPNSQEMSCVFSAAGGYLRTGWPQISAALGLQRLDVVQICQQEPGSSRFYMKKLAAGAAPTASPPATSGAQASPMPQDPQQDTNAEAQQAVVAAPVRPTSAVDFTMQLPQRYTGSSLLIPLSRQPAFAAIEANLQGSRCFTMVLPGGQEVRCSYTIAHGHVYTGWPAVSAALGLQPLDELHICKQQPGGSRFLINKGLAGAATGTSPPVGVPEGPALLQQLQSPATAALTGAAVETSSSPCTSPELQEPQQPQDLELIPSGAASVDPAQPRLPRGVLLTKKLTASDSAQVGALAIFVVFSNVERPAIWLLRPARQV